MRRSARRQRVAVHEVGVIAVVQTRRAARAAQRSQACSSPCAERGGPAPRGKRAARPGNDAETARRRLRRKPRTAAASRGRCRAPAGVKRGHHLDPGRRRRSRAMASAAAPTPGRITCVAARIRAASADDARAWRSGARSANCSEAMLAPPLATMATSLCAHSTPLVLGSSLPSRRTACRRLRPTPLKHASIM